MAKCANCGKRIRPDGSVQLCRRCAACTNLYQAKVQRIRQNIVSGFSSGVFFGIVSVLILLLGKGTFWHVAGTMLGYYALCSFLFPLAIGLSQYIQLRLQLKAQLEAKEQLNE